MAEKLDFMNTVLGTNLFIRKMKRWNWLVKQEMMWLNTTLSLKVILFYIRSKSENDIFSYHLKIKCLTRSTGKQGRKNIEIGFVEK